MSSFCETIIVLSYAKSVLKNKTRLIWYDHLKDILHVSTIEMHLCDLQKNIDFHIYSCVKHTLIKKTCSFLIFLSKLFFKGLHN